VPLITALGLPAIASRRERAWRLVGWMLVAAIVFLSLGPATGPELPLPEGDKWGHALAYAVATWWWGMLYVRSRTRWLLCAAFIVLGVALEFVQGLTDYRTFDVLDMAADAAGAVLARLALGTPRWRTQPRR
jgi:VanZ family protein